MQSLTLADASRRFLQLHVKLRLETQNGQHTISLSIAAIINKWSKLKFSFNVKSWIKLLFKRAVSTKLFKCEYHKQSQYSVSAKQIVSGRQFAVAIILLLYL